MRRWNLPLVLGCILGLVLLVLLLLPTVMEFRHPHMGQLVFWIDNAINRPPLKPGVEGFLLGTDQVGRDLLARLVFGARNTLGIALAVTLLRALVAVPVGLFVGWYDGRANQIVSTLSASFIAIPTIVFCAIFLRGLRSIVTNPNDWIYFYTGVIVVAGLPRMIEFVRQRTQEISVMPFVEGAVAIGAPGRRIMSHHLLPMMVGDILIMLAAEMAWVLLMMGQLAVIGVFVGGYVQVLQHNSTLTVEYTAEWAQMLGVNLKLLRTYPLVPLLPAVGITLACVCFHLLAEGLRLRRIAR